ncbi:X box binding protein 1 isoform X2 [Rhynchophorus ferrugineus]|uniref:X box binding protein 1 isoform X2 n=1 Tax=Rhynchophorus ferrugineus TaxID=354439 RepID=UPI003FCE7E68
MMTTLPVPTILNILNDENNNYMMDQNTDTPVRARKRRLDHLSWEEKIQRKKLKNRVAAQTSRDRKKAKLEQMEKAIQQLFSKNEKLISECEQLKVTNERLQAENAELRDRLQGVEQCQCQNRPVVCKSECGSTESLLRPKGTGMHTAAALTSRRRTILLKTILTCLLYRTCSTNLTARRSISTPSNNSPKLCSKTLLGISNVLRKKQLNRKQQPSAQKIKLGKWWGRHQKTWNPVEAKC